MMKLMRNIGWVFLASLFFTLGCNKDEIGPQQVDETSEVSGALAVVLNEGNFNFGNASISVVDSSGSVINNAFDQANGEPLGDVLQSAVQIGDRLYFVLNNSGKIVITNLDFEKVAEISGLNSPRYILPVASDKAFVSDLYSDAISIVDLNSNQVIGEISNSGWVEQMILTNGKVFAANQDLPGLSIINPETNEITENLELEAAPSGMVMDANGFLWVICTGGLSGENPTLFKIDPISLSLTSFSLPEGVSGYLQTDVTKNLLYFAIESGIVEMSVQAEEIPSTVHLPTNDFLLYGFSVDPTSGNLWLLDAEDYVQNGEAHVYTSSGDAIFSKQVGKLPNGVLFVQ